MKKEPWATKGSRGGGGQGWRRAWSIYNKSALPASTRASSSCCAPKDVQQCAKVKERCSQMKEGQGSGCKLSAELAGTALTACLGWGVQTGLVSHTPPPVHG